MAEQGLENTCVWLTRPLDQVSGIMDWLQSRGARVRHIPLLHIEPLACDERVRARMLNLDSYDMAIFISSNAARIGMQYVHDFWPQYPAHIRNFAVGPGTAAIIQNHQLDVSWPRQGMGSEALLALPALQEISHKRILIFRGLGGRETLADGLRARGAIPDYVELYRRIAPDYSHGYLMNAIRDYPPDTIVISSAEALESLLSLFAGIFPALFDTRVRVSSPRLCELAREAGFRSIQVMAGADDEAIRDSFTERSPVNVAAVNSEGARQ
ncbi:MAG: uroporphyrinogen-III synthase [Pseudomonadales bacterium]|nr:uroporphyrinogen-III synthase [Pseudomonadales bacterium]